MNLTDIGLGKFSTIFLVFLLFSPSSCKNYGGLTFLATLPSELKEVSGMETGNGAELVWMLNDGGNSPSLYGIDSKGKILKKVSIKAKNRDWEDLARDDKGNLFIGDFGNNSNKRKNLTVLKVKERDLLKKGSAEVDRINFVYDDQKKFPPKKTKKNFDCEAFIYFNDHLYLFTKSRVKGNFGRTNLYRLPAKKGNQKAKFVASFSGCTDLSCWVTSADLSPDGKKLALLTHKSLYVFSNFKGDDFFGGQVKEIELGHLSQKEGLCFVSNEVVLISDERAHGSGGNVYQFRIDI